jgi:hypothetical protein
MANLTLVGRFFNNNFQGVSVSIFQFGNLVTDNPPDTLVSPNPDNGDVNGNINHLVTLPVGSYIISVVGDSDGTFAFDVPGNGFTINPPVPKQYNGAFNDNYQLNVLV